MLTLQKISFIGVKEIQNKSKVVTFYRSFDGRGQSSFIFYSAMWASEGDHR